LRRAYVPRDQASVFFSGLRVAREEQGLGKENKKVGKAGEDAPEEEEGRGKRVGSVGTLPFLPPPLLVSWSELTGRPTDGNKPLWLAAVLSDRLKAPRPDCGVCDVCYGAGGKAAACWCKELLDKTEFAWYSPYSNHFLICPETNEIAILQPISFPGVERGGYEIPTW
jgi:hypothetical protein